MGRERMRRTRTSAPVVPPPPSSPLPHRHHRENGTDATSDPTRMEEGEEQDSARRTSSQEVDYLNFERRPRQGGKDANTTYGDITTHADDMLGGEGVGGHHEPSWSDDGYILVHGDDGARDDDEVGVMVFGLMSDECDDGGRSDVVDPSPPPPPSPYVGGMRAQHKEGEDHACRIHTRDRRRHAGAPRSKHSDMSIVAERFHYEFAPEVTSHKHIDRRAGPDGGWNGGCDGGWDGGRGHGRRGRDPGGIDGPRRHSYVFHSLANNIVTCSIHEGSNARSCVCSRERLWRHGKKRNDDMQRFSSAPTVKDHPSNNKPPTERISSSGVRGGRQEGQRTGRQGISGSGYWDLSPGLAAPRDARPRDQADDDLQGEIYRQCARTVTSSSAEAAPCDVDYVGTVSLLELRGGGGPANERRAHESDTGAGMRAFMEESDSDLTDDHPPQPHSPAQDISHGRRITGRQGESQVIMCEGCYADIPLRGITWHQCGCPRFRCQRCAHQSCTICGVVAAATVDNFAQPAPDGTEDAYDGRFDLRDIDAFNWDPKNAPHETGQTPHRAAIRCASCCTDSCSWRGAWAVCKCWLHYCSSCYRRGCEVCGQAHPAEDNSPHHDARQQDVYSEDGYCRGEGHDITQEDVGIEFMPMPTILAPREAHARREDIMQEAAERNRERRTEGRRRVREQQASGVRPRRMRNKGNWISFGSANISLSPQKLRDELSRQGDLARCDFLAIQEHGLHDEGINVASDWVKKLGWTGVIDEAYAKSGGHGGGTAALSRHPEGLRRAGARRCGLRGRCTLGITQLCTAVTFCAFYGITGAAVSSQCPIWKQLADDLLGLGRPFVVAGDWQKHPDELRASGICKVLDAEVCAPSCATNVNSGGKLDYFLVSRTLLHHGWQVQPLYGCNFKPHIPIVLHLNLHTIASPTRRLKQPRILPVHRPMGPHLPGIIIDWAKWSDPAAERDAAPADDRITDSMNEWYAGAEAELLTQYDLIGHSEEHSYMGLGMPPEEVMETAVKRFRDVPDNFGILGHRLEWTCKAVHLALSLGPIIIESAGTTCGSDRARQHVDTLSRYGHRACSFAREVHKRPNDDDGAAFWPLITRGQKMVGELVRNRHGRRPWLCEWTKGAGRQGLSRYQDIATELEDALLRLARERTRRMRAKARRWAASLPADAGHRLTKASEATLSLSASSEKSHHGERTPQAAADAGEREWGPIWKSSEQDQSEAIMDALSRMQANADDDDSYPIIHLPPIDPTRLGYAARRVRATTGVGGDWIRMGHIGRLLSAGALAALAKWYEAVEKYGKWPAAIRNVIEVALSKKAGGARLVGLAASLYRIWAKVRYQDIRAVLEQRLARPELCAAPGRGAASTAFELSLAAEVANARDGVAATSIVDISKFFEYVDILDFAMPALKLGIPKVILALAGHFYLGPRRLRVSGAYSRALHPRRSIVAGCTWCTVFIRVAVNKPLDGLAVRLRSWTRDWDVKMAMRMYIDDCMISTTGSLTNVSMVHAWASIYVVNWVKAVLHKKVALAKLQCIAANNQLRKALRERLKDVGYNVRKIGDLLGADFSSGGRLTRRRMQEQRRRRARKRRGKLKWWSKVGRDAGRIVDSGLFPSETYGMNCSGLPPAVLRDLRRSRGAFSSVKCHGSSLTAKLATAGIKFTEADPAALHPAPPFRAISEALWDFPRLRFTFCFAWRRAVRDFVENEGTWTDIRGPVGAAFCHLRRIGAEWIAPFRISINDVIIDILVTPPKQVYAYLQDAARVSLDKAFVARMAADKGWNYQQVAERYKFGIDWAMVRAVLLSSSLRPTSRRALQVVQSGGFWSDERRWMNGLADNPECTTCHEAVGDEEHYFAGQCPAVQIELMWKRIAGEDHIIPGSFDDPGLAPLNFLALPPRWEEWRPVEDAPMEGWLSMGPDGMSYGDGSGYNQQQRDSRIATWAVVRLGRGSGGETVRAEGLRGPVPGLFPTVPRAEMIALLQHLRHAGPNAGYGGDCQHVLDTARHGIDAYYTSSKCINADIWRDIKAALADHEAPVVLRKIKAHVSQNAAAEQGASTEDWRGNQLADQYCKTLAKSMAEARDGDGRKTAAKQFYRHTINHISIIAAWAFRYRPQYAKGGGRKRRQLTRNDADGQHHFQEIGAEKWRCTSCRREAWSRLALKRLRRTECCGHVARICHSSHSLLTTNGVLWCRKCGGYTTRQPRLLRFQCAERPRSEAAFNVRARLMRGLPPTTAGYLGAASIMDTGPYFCRETRPGNQETSRTAAAPKDTATAADGDGAPHHLPGHMDGRICGREHDVRPIDVQTNADVNLPDSDASHGHGGHGEPFCEDAHEQTPAPSAIRRRIRGKSAPTSAGQSNRDGNAESTPKAAGAASGVTFEPRGHGIYERIARTRYRQLDIRAARNDPGREADIPGTEPLTHSLMGDASRKTRGPPQPSRELCKPAAFSSWTQRLTIVRSTAVVNCRICNAGSRSRCAGCGAPCCVGCARARRHCATVSVEPTASSSGTAEPADFKRRDARAAAADPPHEADNLLHHPRRSHHHHGPAASPGGSESSSARVGPGAGAPVHMCSHHPHHPSEVFEACASHAVSGSASPPPPQVRAHTDTDDDAAAAAPAALAVSSLLLSQGVAVADVDDAHRMCQHALHSAAGSSS